MLSLQAVETLELWVGILTPTFRVVMAGLVRLVPAVRVIASAAKQSSAEALPWIASSLRSSQ
jgi:hypothetical protein